MKRLLIVTALMSEAVPIINFYRMRKQPKRGPYHLFLCISPEETFELRLVVAGIGAENMYRSLKAYLDAQQNVSQIAYLNIGIAGASQETIGRLIWANAIAATSIGLPEGVQNSPYTVRSVEVPSHQYQPGILFDMEAESCLQCIAKMHNSSYRTRCFVLKWFPIIEAHMPTILISTGSRISCTKISADSISALIIL